MLVRFAVVGARKAAVGEAENAVGDVVAAPVRLVGEADLQLVDGDAADCEVAQAHRTTDALAAAKRQVEVKAGQLAPAKAVNVIVAVPAGRLWILAVVPVDTGKRRLDGPGIAAARVEQQPDGPAVPFGLNAVLSRVAVQSGDVLVRRARNMGLDAGHGGRGVVSVDGRLDGPEGLVLRRDLVLDRGRGGLGVGRTGKTHVRDAPQRRGVDDIGHHRLSVEIDKRRGPARHTGIRCGGRQASGDASQKADDKGRDLHCGLSKL